ncbi:adhesion G protein-coupled receptor B3-like protein [Willisornis vidua]|uniref:Adhesion G protein-coupled receptor B3-like protein n=1 Tax=Willisornis vidua TaxID=1566151 RepID=A0ABQ9CVA8_9PASS|nr:adhesion G protein-coupled receptor B3-like protein [Willisornis vidua]
MGQVLGPVLVSQQLHATLQMWGKISGKLPRGKEPWDAAQQPADHKPTVCPGGQEGQWNPGLYQKSCGQQDQGVCSSFYSVLIKEHLAKGQRMLAGDGMSQVTKTLLDLTQRKNFYAGDLLISVEILRNVTDTFKRASYIPASDGVQNFFQIISNLLDEENKEKWEDAQQIYPGSVELMQVIEDFIHIVGMGMMDFQNSYLMTGNVGKTKDS